MILKEYQVQALDTFSGFLRLCRESNNPRDAFGKATREWFGQPLPYHDFLGNGDVPYVCLRIPTGGGKTLVGGLSIERVTRELLLGEFTLTLWLVPSDPIRVQTLNALRNRDHLLYGAVTSALGSVSVLDIDEARYIQPATLNGSHVIIVSTMQSFKQEETDRLSVYRQNGQLMPHFEGKTDQTVIGNHSLVDVIRMRHPYIVVDEAHNQGTPSAFDTLARFEPRAILELTATPDRWFQPSNILYSVSAAALNAAEMIKLPLELVRRTIWQDALRDAIAKLNELQTKAEEERIATKEYIRPIMLLQAERHDAHRETLIPEKIKQALIDDYGIPPDQIAISTGTTDELAGVNILSPACNVRFIITIDKLREGWDCPFAYVLCTFRDSTSSTAVEQILGRILRMPEARRKNNPELNRAYAVVTSNSFHTTVECLRDGLVRNGFERQEATDFINPVSSPEQTDFFASPPSSITFATPELPAPEAIPEILRNKIDIVPESGAVTFKGNWTKRHEDAINIVFRTPEGREAARQALQTLHQPAATRPRTPSESGNKFRVPMLSYRNAGLWEVFEETHLLQGEWSLLNFSSELSEREFSKPEVGVQGGVFTITADERVRFEYFDKIAEQLSFMEFQNNWDQIQLVSWLERNIPEDSIPPDEKAAFLNTAITYLIEAREFSLEELVYMKAKLRGALEEKIKNAKFDAMHREYQRLLAIPGNFKVSDDLVTVFEEGRYSYNFRYQGFQMLPKHFFPEIGDLHETGEEFECAVFLSTELEGLKHWVRNIPRKERSFSLQTGTDRFYPDFVCMLENGKVLVVEYKNERDWVLPENVEKRQIGELWERRSNGRGLFIMPRGKDWEAIRHKASE